LNIENLGFPNDGQALYEKLIAYHQELKSQMVIPEEELNQDIVNVLLIDERPLISRIPPRIEKEFFQEIVRKICLLFIQYVPEREKEIKDILNLNSQLYVNINSQSFLDEHKEISGDLLSLIMDNAYRPYFLALAERLSVYTDLSLWRENYCPVCGEKASLASHDEENGQRALWCSFCNIGWSFPRLVCTECGNSNHEELKCFFLEDDRSFQFHTCSRCNSYIKSVRRNIIGPENLPLVNVQTVCLDLLAEKEGYNRR